jgi:rare lipoprotein A
MSWKSRSLTVVLMMTCVAGCHPRAGAQDNARPLSPVRTQIGLASYYGPGFHGERTASGEVFDQNELVAAHPTIEFGTLLRVTNLENGRSVVVRVVDRGPYGRNRRKGAIIDLSQGAARRLRFVRDGIVRVRVEILRRAATEPRAGNRNDGL